MNDGMLLVPVLVPLFAGVLSFFIPSRARWARESMTAAAILATLGTGAWLLTGMELHFQTGDVVIGIPYLDLFSSHFNSLMLVFAAIISLLVTAYSFRYMAGAPRAGEFYAYLLITLGAVSGALLSENLVPFIAFWGMALVTLFLLSTIGTRGASPDEVSRTAQKNLMILGSADAAMVVGLGLLWHVSGSFSIGEAVASASGAEGTTALVLILLGAMAKIGAMPLHSWIPQMSETSPTPVMAFLPASMDKLLGAYLLGRLVMGLPAVSTGMGLFLMAVGAATIILSTMMALVQSDTRKLLAFLAISSAGYILLGLGTGNTTGTAGALLYLLNTTLWMSCLFMCAGAVELQTGRVTLDRLGGLGRAMPATFAAALIAGLSMSAVPPLSGFVAKWMIYQGVLEAGAARYWVFLIAAMFGSALTLASVVKLLHSTFLGQRAAGLEGSREAPPTMVVPAAVLATFCLVFGVFAQLPLSHFICPIVGESLYSFPGAITGIGVWNPTLATVLILAALAIGAAVYLAGNVRQAREMPVYIGGEVMDPEGTRVLGTQFFDTIASLRPLSWLYRKGEAAAFDIYSYGKPFLALAEGLRRLHTGRLSMYLAWCLLGLIALALTLVGIR